MKIVQSPYYISTNGVYRCCKLLQNITFYHEENGFACREESNVFPYKAIKKMLEANYLPILINGIKMYNGEILWNDFFLKNDFLNSCIERLNIESIAQLHYYANEEANRR